MEKRDRHVIQAPASDFSMKRAKEIIEAPEVIGGLIFPINLTHDSKDYELFFALNNVDLEPLDFEFKFPSRNNDPKRENNIDTSEV